MLYEVITKGRDLEKLQMLCKTLNITNEVIFQGFDTNPYKWIKKAELLVHSSKFEGLPTRITSYNVCYTKLLRVVFLQWRFGAYKWQMPLLELYNPFGFHLSDLWQ